MVLTVYYKPAEGPEFGVVEVSEDVLTLYKEYDYTLPDGEEVKAKLYMINATTILGDPS